MRAVAVRAKELRYAVDLTTAGELTDENGVALDAPAEWTPEHLLLAALVRCSLKSLRYHAERRGVDVRSASGSSRTFVTKRETDERYALIETDVELVVELEDGYGIRMPEDEAERIKTVGQAIDFVLSHVPAHPAS